MTIQTTSLGNTNLKVTRLGYGTMELRDLKGKRSHPSSMMLGRLSTESQADRSLNAALDAGITFIDTAWAYGRSEEFIGRFISHRRDEYVLATKVGNRYRGCSSTNGWTPLALSNCLDESLCRLRTTEVDLLQLHNPTPADLSDGSCLHALEIMKKQGKFRFLGISSGFPHINAFLEMGVFDTVQVPFSAIFPENLDAICRAASMGVGVIVRGILGEGVPLGTVNKRALFEKLLSRWQDEAVKEKFGGNVSNTLIRYVLAKSNIDVALFGSLNPDHILANSCASKQTPLSEEEVSQIESVVKLAIDVN